MGIYNPHLIQIPVESFNYGNQSTTDGDTNVRSSKWNTEAQYNGFTKFVDRNATTMWETFRFGASKSHGGPCLGWRQSPFSPYQWMTYDDVIR